MRICDLQTGMIRISRANKSLRDQWRETSEHWNDANREEFDKQSIQPLGPQVTMLVAAIHRMHDVLEQAERELRDKDREE